MISVMKSNVQVALFGMDHLVLILMNVPIILIIALMVTIVLILVVAINAKILMNVI